MAGSAGQPMDAEAAATAYEGVRALLHLMGDDPDREGLVETPARVVRAMREMTAGLALDPATILGTTFDVSSDEMVVVTGIEFVSLCEHHLLPFTGTAAVGYLPRERVVGLSKLARLVELYARRPQVQERMTRQITEALDEHLPSGGAACVLRASHSCMSCRGVRKTASMVTSSLTGAFRDDPATRAEFLALTRA